MKNINEGRRRKAITNLHGLNQNVKSFCIISPDNPMSARDPEGNDTLTKNENAILEKEFIDFLIQHQYIFFKAYGKYNSVEQTFIVYNVSLDSCFAMAKRWDQESFIFATPNVEERNVQFDFYRKEKSESDKDAIEKDKTYFLEDSSVTIDDVDAEQQDFYTGIGKNYKFSIPFSIFQEGVEEINRLVDGRKSNFDEYARLFDSKLMESVAPHGNPRHQRMCRAFLWGSNFQKMLH